MSYETVSKPFAGFEDFDACVSAHTGEVEDPEAFCAWLQDEAKDALSDPNAKEVLTGLTSEFVSSVDRPAQDSEWLIMKDAGTPRKKAKESERPYVFPKDGEPCGRATKGEDPCEDGWVMVGTKPADGGGVVPNCVPEEDVDDPPNIESETAGLPDDFDVDEFNKTVAEKAADGVDVTAVNDDGEKQIAYAAVLIPNEPDKQGDVIPPYVVERSAHEYMAEYRKMDSDHDLEDDAGVPVESWILKDEETFETPDGNEVTYPAGTWILAKRFVDDEWERVKSGELNGFSIYGAGTPIDVGELKSEVKRASTEANPDQTMKNDDDKNPIAKAVDDALSSPTPEATFTDRLTEKAEVPDETVEDMVDMLRSSADMLEDSMSGGDDGDDEGEPEADSEHGDDMETEEDEYENKNMKDENGTGGDAGTNDPSTDDAGLPDDTPDWAVSLSKDVRGSVDEVREDVDDLRGRVDSLEKEVSDDAAPENDRLEGENGGDGSADNDRMKSVEKKVDRLYEAVGADPDEDNDPDVVRKGIRESANQPDTETESESYDGIVDDEPVNKSASGGGVEGNARLSGDD